MNNWRTAVIAALVGFSLGWFVHMRVSDPQIARCHQALQVLTKGASMQQLQESSKILNP